MRNKPAGSVAQDPKQADVHFTLGLSMSDNDSFLEQAKKEFESSIRFDATHKEAAYNLALMCYKLGQWDECRVALQRYMALAADDQLAKKLISLLHDDGN
jgi:tetratricopeptide (TPR) repeat protein